MCARYDIILADGDDLKFSVKKKDGALEKIQNMAWRRSIASRRV